MLKAGKREGLLAILIHPLAVFKGLKMSQSFFEARRKRDNEQEKGKKHRREMYVSIKEPSCSTMARNVFLVLSC